MKEKISKALTEGLLSGYAGKGEISEVKRANLLGFSSHLETEEAIYHDEWFVPGYLGGGQEMIKVGDQMFTRLYGGGTPDPEYLKSLGISVKEVGAYLKEKITELGDQTRLFVDCQPEVDGDWQYRYIVLENEDSMGVIIAKEEIFYQGKKVHLHPFILSPIK